MNGTTRPVAPGTEAATINVPEAAALLGISRAVAYKLASTGELPGALRLGRRIVVSRRALEKALGDDEQAA